MRFLTAGESHGKEMLTIIEGFPANVPIDETEIVEVLRRRRMAPGRSRRMDVESDDFRVLAGMVGGVTLGAPLAVAIANAPEVRLVQALDPWTGGGTPQTVPRPGHADLAGGIKYRQPDLRLVPERASARETVARTVAGCFALQLLKLLGVEVRGKALVYGDIAEAARTGDTLGGVVEVIVTGLPGGIGSYVHWERRLDARLAGAVMGIQAVKGVEFGPAFAAVRLPGSLYHDEFTLEDGQVRRRSNNAGGVEGGMSNGQPIRLRAAVKPVPTLSRPLASFDLSGKTPCPAPVSRHDTSAVGAAAVVVEAVVAWEIAAALVEQFGGDTLEDLNQRYGQYRERWQEAVTWPGP